MEPKPTYTTAGDVQFYVKATSNCEPLGLTTLQALFGGEWSTLGFRSSAVLIKTGPDLTPRLVVGWTDLYGGMATSCTVYERIGEHDEPAWAIVGGNSGLRILANMEEHGDFEDEHLPPGWGTPVLLIEDADDIVDEALRKALNLDSGQPLYEPPDWSADDDEPELDFDDLAAIARAWPWNVKDALGRFVALKMQQAGIDDERKRLAVQSELLRLLEE